MSIIPSLVSAAQHQSAPPLPIASAVTARKGRPLICLSCELLQTYKLINERFYTNKRKSKATGEDPARPKPIFNEGFDDDSGNYLVQIGEELAQRYIVREVLGKGSFGVVVKAYDQRRDEQVAVKIIRNRPQFFTQARVEIDIVSKLNEAGGDAHNLVRLKKYLTWKDHLCLVFELLSFNLYDLIKFTKFQGVSLNLIRKFTVQLLSALEFMRVAVASKPVIHCDLKPENVLLVNSKRSAIKVIDFGSSCFESRRMFKYIQSRFYRSPEVILNLTYTCAIDMWSLGCILIELHTGIPLFDGKSEVDQLVRMQAVLGPIPTALAESSPKRDTLFELNPRGELCLRQPSMVPSPITRTLETVVSAVQGRRLGQAGHGPSDYAEFLDLVRLMLQYNPVTRITPSTALQHAFVQGAANNTLSGGVNASED